MKKIVLMMGMAVSPMLIAEEVPSVDTFESEISGESGDQFSSLYFSAGGGLDWMKNKGDVSDNEGSVSISEQKPTSFHGLFGIGYQKLVAQQFLIGLEFNCSIGENKDNDVWVYYEGCPSSMESKIKNKGITPGVFAKMGVTFCDKHLVYTKLGVQWPSTKVEIYNARTEGRDGHDINKGVFAAALGYQYKFTKKVSAFGEVTYAAKQKKDINVDSFDARENTTYQSKWSVKARDSWGFNVGVVYHMLMK